MNDWLVLHIGAVNLSCTYANYSVVGEREPTANREVNRGDYPRLRRM